MSDAKPARILVVDDVAANRYAAVRILQRAGYQVSEASTGEAALAAADEHPDLIVLDVHLPDMLGYEVSERLRARPDTAHIAILHLSASYTTNEAQATGLKRGADAYLVHPVDSEVLTATVGALLRLRAAEHAARAAFERERQLRSELEEVIRSRDELLSVASHDLRNPMSSIGMRISLLLRALRSGDVEQFTPAKLVPVLEQMDSQVARLVRLLEDLLDVTRITTGRVSLDVRRVDLCQITREIAERFRQEPGGAGITVHAECSILGSTDPVRVDQVITNLVSNAVKYGSGNPIDLEVRSKDERVTIVVRDHGIGIAQEDQKRIFNRFERATLDRREGSYGVGLWIVAKLVKALGGSVSVESKLGEGSTFTVDLPLVAPTTPSRDVAVPHVSWH